VSAARSASVARPVAASPEAVLVDAFLDNLWMERGLSRNTLNAYRTDLLQLAVWLAGRGVTLAEVGREHLLRHLAWRVEQGRQARSTARFLSSVRRFYRYLVREGRIGADPSARIDGPKLGRPLPKSLTESEVDTLLQVPDTADALGLRDRAMLDTHFMLGQARIAAAADPDVLNGFDGLLRGMGAELVAAVAPVRVPVLERMSAARVQIGDLEDLEHAARANGARLLIGSSHAAESARRLGVPLLRAGFPQHDRVGGCQRTWIGYQGARQALFDLANLLLMQDHHEIEPYHSIYAQKSG
jgi:hypothetical protein